MHDFGAILRTAICFPLTLSLMLGIAGLRTKTKQERMEAELEKQIAQDFVPVFRFAIASDVHVRDASAPRNAERFAEMFRSAYRYSDTHPAYTALDAVLHRENSIQQWQNSYLSQIHTEQSPG